jgi:hypothetical protein
MFAVQPQAVPSRSCGAKLSERDLQRIAGLGSLDRDGPETGLILPKSRSITSCSVEDGSELARRGVVAVEQDGRAGRHPFGRDKRVVPAEVVLPPWIV